LKNSVTTTESEIMGKRKKNRQKQPPISSDAEKLDNKLLKLHYKLAEINAKLSQMERQLNRVETLIDSIYKHLDRIDRRTEFMIKYIEYKEENTLRNKIRKLLGKHPIIKLP